MKTSDTLNKLSEDILNKFLKLELADNVLTNQRKNLDLNIVKDVIVKSDLLKEEIIELHTEFNKESISLGNQEVLIDDLFDVCRMLIKESLS